MDLNIVAMEITTSGYDAIVDEGEKYVRYYFDIKDWVAKKKAEFFKKDFPAQGQFSSYQVFAESWANLILMFSVWKSRFRSLLSKITEKSITAS